MSNHADIVAALQARWPEHRIARSLSRIEALCDLLGEPQRSCPVIQVAGNGLKRDDPDFITASVASYILGGGSFSSRLYKEIREKRGLAYSVWLGLIPLDHAGLWFVSTSTRSR